MEWKEMNDKRWELFLQILNKENLDLKGNSMGIPLLRKNIIKNIKK